MRNLKVLFFALVASAILTSCNEEDIIPVFSGDVSVTLISKGSSEVIEGEAATFTYDVVLNQKFDKDITINFDLDELENYPNLLSIAPVTIVKDQVKGILTVTATKKPDVENVLKDNLNLTFSIKDYQGITNVLTLSSNYMVIVKAEEGITPLTAAQQELIKHYKTKGIDVSMWIGKIPVKVEVVTAPGGSFAPFEVSETLNYTGITHITLSKNATKDKPLLVMSQNALGLSEYLQYVFRSETILNTEYWYGPDNPDLPPSVKAVLKALGDERINKWKNKEYSFNLKVDDLEFTTEGKIEFVRGNNTYDIYADFTDSNRVKDLAAVDFQYEFSLWDELLTLVEGNDDLKNHIIQGGSVHPNNYIGYSTILTDDWYEGDWEAPTSSYNATEMNFTFNTDHTSSNSYDIVRVNFTLPSN